MNAHAFRSDDLATACRLDVEEQERKRQKDAKRAERRARAAERQRRFMDWYRWRDGDTLLWGVVVVLLFVRLVVLGGMIADRVETASNWRDKIACYRVCKAAGKSTIMSVGTTPMKDVGQLCVLPVGRREGGAGVGRAVRGATTMKLKMVSLHLSDEMLERASKLVPAMKDIELSVVKKITRNTVLRLAVLYGLKALEAKYGPKVKP